MLACSSGTIYNECISLLMSSTAGSIACISPASSHSAPSRNPTHSWWWRGGALDHHCVYRSCSTLYCSTSWPLMGGKTPNITTLAHSDHTTHSHNHTTHSHNHTSHPHNHTTQCGFFSRKKQQEFRRKRQALTDPTASTENILEGEVEPSHDIINGK